MNDIFFAGDWSAQWVNLKGWGQCCGLNLPYSFPFYLSSNQLLFPKPMLQMNWDEGRRWRRANPSPLVEKGLKTSSLIMCCGFVVICKARKTRTALPDHLPDLISSETYLNFLLPYLFICCKSPGPPANTHALQNLGKSSETLQQLWTIV